MATPRPYLRPSRDVASQYQHRIASTSRPLAPCSTFGLPTPNSFRISTPKLYPATCTTYRFVTLSSPRSHVRRPPPVSQTWAKLRSTNSPRPPSSPFLPSPFPPPPLTRRRFPCTARRHASGLSCQLYSLPLGSGMYVRVLHCWHSASVWALW